MLAPSLAIYHQQTVIIQGAKLNIILTSFIQASSKPKQIITIREHRIIIVIIICVAALIKKHLTA